MTMTDNNVLSNNKIKRFDNYSRGGSRNENASKCKVILEIGLATIYPLNQIDIDDNMTLRCYDSICTECGNDHSFDPNFEGVITNIDTIPKIFPGLFYKPGEN
jgi:hypothetical protein